MNIKGIIHEIKVYLGREEAFIPVEVYLNPNDIALLVDLPDKNVSIRLEVVDGEVNLEYKITKEEDGKPSRTNITLYRFGDGDKKG